MTGSPPRLRPDRAAPGARDSHHTVPHMPPAVTGPKQLEADTIRRGDQPRRQSIPLLAVTASVNRVPRALRGTASAREAA
ncbi:hypothetical protein DFR74_115158 [Nocardia puris]|uniref:Uncharacterized protein n=1 Tax=Nocardia puris TaxID=208602 RepID=A0A366D5K7_9NOCA|nr:hypothetical protein DFR74_115158 [Nocardia puris]